MLLWIFLVLSILLGIDVGAEVLGYSPQAYVGGLIGAAAFFIIYKFARLEPEESSGQEETQFVHGEKQDQLWPPLPKEFSNAVPVLPVVPEIERRESSGNLPPSGSELPPRLDRLKSTPKRSGAPRPPPQSLDIEKREHRHRRHSSRSRRAEPLSALDRLKSILKRLGG